ncbi:hypothetical protein DEO23_14095 [Brachybacterium endophyticum]|uniref:Uncharacterized protein n=1 Tax=Brachybacterium endophyticum TaxID=2182385 RepID=A0A2U2RH74_9MICO|nr:hypothetical protein [Brachybacterium endophyticum]PWH05207.1 hypothetical protein DEO23_14095 [Brachybacterium endophyticum]
MKTNTYLGLVSLQMAGMTIQKNRLAKEQADRDAELQRITQESAQVSQNAHFAQWRTTPEGQHFQHWKNHARDTAATIQARDDAWNAILDTAINNARDTVDTNPGRHPSLDKKIRNYAIATGATWILAFILVGISDGSETPLGFLGGVIGLLAIIATVLLVLTIRQRGQLRTDAHADALLEAETNARARYGNSPSWHTSLSLGHLDDAARKITAQITNGPREFPAPSDLLPLASLYSTRAVGTYPTDLPSEAQQLLDVFATEDRQRIQQLQEAQLQ